MELCQKTIGRRGENFPEVFFKQLETVKMFGPRKGGYPDDRFERNGIIETGIKFFAVFLKIFLGKITAFIATTFFVFGRVICR